MKNTYCALCLVLLLHSGIASASPTQMNYQCGVNGCQVHCKTEQGQWQQYEQANRSVVTVNHDNGNVEILIDDGVDGKRTLWISPKNLLCEVKGYN